MKRFYKPFIALLVLVGVSSCQEYHDINQSPTDPTQEIVPPDLLLPGALTEPHPVIAVTANELGNVFMNNWAGDVNNVTGGFINEFRLNITTTFYSSIWDNLYRSLGTSQSIIDYESEEYDNHKAIARINKTFYFQYLVDLYGDIPYTEALQGAENITPAYDDDVQIYRDLITELDLALEEIENADNLDVSVGAEDVIYNGDMQAWARFANTLKLRILVRQMELAEQDAEVQSYLNQQFANLDTDFLTENATINPGYTDADNRQNPFYANYGYNPQGDPTFDRNFVVASDYAANFLQGTETEVGFSTGVYDPRVEALYETFDYDGDGDEEVVGVQQGADNTTAPTELSRLGEGLVRDASQSGYVFTAAESYFLQAEAVHRGYLSGNAKALFQEGIISSFITLGLTEGDAQDYISNSNNLNRIGWDGSANKIEAIMTQKWIALNGINGLESWIEYTRTGYPQVPLAITAQEPQKPNRLLYPASEYSTNTANVTAMGQQQSDAFNTNVFWDAN